MGAMTLELCLLHSPLSIADLRRSPAKLVDQAVSAVCRTLCIEAAAASGATVGADALTSMALLCSNAEDRYLSELSGVLLHRVALESTVREVRLRPVFGAASAECDTPATPGALCIRAELQGSATGVGIPVDGLQGSSTAAAVEVPDSFAALIKVRYWKRWNVGLVDVARHSGLLSSHLFRARLLLAFYLMHQSKRPS